MIAAAAMAASAWPFAASSESCGSTRSMKPVSNFAARKSAWSMMKRKNGMVVSMPSTRYSTSARRIRAIASARVGAWQTSFDSIGS